MTKSLVFSLDNKNLKDNENILLAGEWVLECSKKNTDNLNYDIFYSISDANKQRLTNSVNSNEIYQNIFQDLVIKLNELHSLNLSSRSWRILIGHWLKRFVDLCYQKDFIINEILDNQNISKVYGIKNEDYKQYSNDTYAIHPNSRDILWNNNLILNILNFYDFKLEKDFTNLTSQENLVEEYNKSVKFKISTFKKIIFSSFNLLKFLVKKKDALIAGTGMPFKHEKLFELLFFQVPQFYKSEEIFYNKEYDQKLRENIKISYNKNDKNIENFIRKHLHNYIPKCFVENFKNIFENCEKDLPSNPKFIITGVNHDFNETFKTYTAKKVDEGVPYFTLQHGATYFTEDFVLNRCEYETSDKFFTFGYAKKSFCESFYNINTLGKSYKYNKGGLLNMLAPPMLGLFFPYERNQEFLRSFQFINQFEKRINSKLRKKILLRLHSNFTTARGNFFREKYLSNFKDNQIDYRKINYSNFLSNSRVNLFFFDSTGILENLIYNIPTIGIWADKPELLYNHINEEFVERYNFLKEAKIIFHDMNAMINHLENYWDNIEDWWLSKETQDNIKKFNKNFNEKPNFFSLFKLKSKIQNHLENQ